MSMLPPRIRGKVGQAEDGQGVDGKWFFTIFISDFYAKNTQELAGPIGPFDSEAKAKEEMRNACRIVAETYEKKVTGKKKTSGEYLDMKNGGTLRKWEEN